MTSARPNGTIPVGDEGDYDYLSICTGSVFYHAGILYAFYATRRVDEAGSRGEHLCRARSTDGIQFTKDPANPIVSPGGWYDTHNFRDPALFFDERAGEFHMLVTACVREPEVESRAGCLFLAALGSLRTRSASAFGAYYRALEARGLRGYRALMAVMRKMLVVAYHLLKSGEQYDPTKVWSGAAAVATTS